MNKKLIIIGVVLVVGVAAYYFYNKKKGKPGMGMLDKAYRNGGAKIG